MYFCYNHFMTSNKTPANNNFSFSMTVESKQRKLTEDALGPTIELLNRADIPRAMIADVLFSYLKSSAMPPEDALLAESMVWYAQLQRFRSDLDMQIHIIEATLDETHH